MKRNTIKIAIISGLFTFGLVSCNKNKILSPNDKVTSAQVYSTALGYTESMAKVYGAFAFTGQSAPASDGDILGSDVGATDFYRLFFNAEELSTDEAVIAYGDPGIQDLHNMVWSSSNFQTQTLYYRSFFQITLCNDFIRNSTDAMLASRGISGADATNIRYYRAEARFLRAYQYWVLMDLFGNPPFVTDATAVGSIIPPQISRAALFAYIESELKAIDPLLYAPMTNQYGRVDQAAAWALLARMYLNAQVYTGTARYTDAITYANKVIGAGYQLIPKFDNLMLADNNLRSKTGGGTVSEFIFTINYDGTHTQSYGGANYVTHAATGGDMPKDKMGVDYAYGGLRTTSAITSLFPAPATTDQTNFPNNGDVDQRAQFWYDGQSTVINNETVFTDGIGVTKFRNITSQGVTGTSLTFPDIDLPLFRVSEMYFIYAESVLRGGTGGMRSQALTYMNDIRTRAYGNISGNITDTDLTLQYILDERARELMWEGFRRTDLVRYGLFTSSSYVWPWKGGVKGGTGVADFRNLYPIPDADRAVNPNLKQNAGY